MVIFLSLRAYSHTNGENELQMHWRRRWRVPCHEHSSSIYLWHMRGNSCLNVTINWVWRPRRYCDGIWLIFDHNRAWKLSGSHLLVATHLVIVGRPMVVSYPGDCGMICYDSLSWPILVTMDWFFVEAHYGVCRFFCDSLRWPPDVPSDNRFCSWQILRSWQSYFF